ncbi:acyl-diacylglycerol acyltransferase 1-related protein enzyme [Cyclospora cayetanensis]|uniref:diacylglycerol O-acyltransferase n=1 Tax=Cyclospora cayetanensis TaxID=88456 RepID=A0A1D3D539_9EIME|nr:acyl-diacylglycerol acyltransferase 1-related protein enzyme [Cyclospora cayetanensis]
MLSAASHMHIEELQTLHTSGEPPQRQATQRKQSLRTDCPIRAARHSPFQTAAFASTHTSGSKKEAADKTPLFGGNSRTLGESSSGGSNYKSNPCRLQISESHMRSREASSAHSGSSSLPTVPSNTPKNATSFLPARSAGHTHCGSACFPQNGKGAARPHRSGSTMNSAICSQSAAEDVHEGASIKSCMLLVDDDSGTEAAGGAPLQLAARQIPPSVLSPSSSSGLSRASGAATPTGGLVAPATAAVARKSVRLSAAAAAEEEATAASEEAAAARDVWLQHCSSELRLEQLQMLKEETAVNRKKRMQQREEKQSKDAKAHNHRVQHKQQQHQQQQNQHQQQQQQHGRQRRNDEPPAKDSKASTGAIDYRGRPLHDVEHAYYKSSMLSHHSKMLNLRGFFNLFFIVLVVVNASLVTENILTYVSTEYRGLEQELASVMLLHSRTSGNLPRLGVGGGVEMHLCIVGAYVIERFVAAASLRVLDGFVALLILLNLSMCFLMPFLTVPMEQRKEQQPRLLWRVWRLVGPPCAAVAASLLLAFSIVWCFKFFSLHHTCLDTRRAILRGENLVAVCNDREEEARVAALYPYSITLRHVYRFIVLPTMCFQFQYPFTPCIRWFSVLRHVAESAVCLAMMKIVIDQYIWIVVRDSFSITQLQTIPLSVLVSHFFRQDWWNASSFGEYWRKWNLPIHFFLHRHVNKPLLRNGVPKFFAACVVFFISALMHEYLVVVPLQLGWTGFIFFAFIGPFKTTPQSGIASFGSSSVSPGSRLAFCYIGIYGE